MLIASNFHDYYDSIVAFGIDKTVVYDRRLSQRILTYKELRPFPPANNDLFSKKASYTLSPLLVGFCGNIFPAIRLKILDRDTRVPSQVKLFYSTETLLKFFISNSIKIKSGAYFASDRYMRLDSEADFKLFYNHNWLLNLRDVFASNNTPIFTITYKNEYTTISNASYSLILTVNPKLKDYEFAKVKYPATAFQDVYMYISGVLGVPTPKTVDIDDKYKAIEKGHDGKYSFKKPPGKRGRNRWR